MTNLKQQTARARARLSELQAKEQARQNTLAKATNPYAADMAAAQAELDRLEAEEKQSTTRAALRNLAAEAKAHRDALETVVNEGSEALARALDKMERHLEGVRAARRVFVDLAAELTPGIVETQWPGDLDDVAAKAEARALLSELRNAGIDLAAILDGSTGYLSRFDEIKSLPNPEYGGEIWATFVAVKKPEGRLSAPHKRDR